MILNYNSLLKQYRSIAEAFLKVNTNRGYVFTFITENLIVSECYLYHNHRTAIKNLMFKLYHLIDDVEICFDFSEYKSSITYTKYEKGRCFQYRSLSSEKRKYVYYSMKDVYINLMNKGIN
jgi:hypothetical protein